MNKKAQSRRELSSPPISSQGNTCADETMNPAFLRPADSDTQKMYPQEYLHEYPYDEQNPGLTTPDALLNDSPSVPSSPKNTASSASFPSRSPKPAQSTVSSFAPSGEPFAESPTAQSFSGENTNGRMPGQSPSSQETQSSNRTDSSTLAEENDSSIDLSPCGEHISSKEFSHPADRAERLEQLSLEEQMCVLRHLPAEEAAEALAELDGQVARDVLENMDADDAARILAEMWSDDAVDVLDEVEEGHRDVLLSNLTPEDAMELRALLTFDSDTAAGAMNTDIILVQADLYVDEAIRQIRAELEEKEMPYYVYLVDAQDKLVGVLSLRHLMLSRPGTRLRDAAGKQDLITASFDTHKAEVARMLSHYNFLSLPVVDREGHLMGVVTHDDVIDIIQDEATSDMLGMVGAGQDEDVDTPWMHSVKLRLPWLAVNMFNSAMSALIVYMFEGSIAAMALLAVLMPMVANQAGNTGQQALAVMIRQLATERFDRRKAWAAVVREGKIGVFTGVIMAFSAFVGVWALSSNIMLATVMGSALLMDMTLGAVAGGSIPLVLRALGRDPAQASSIFLTALTDGAGFFIFLGMATMFLL